MILTAGALLGLVSVAVGAYAAHGLQTGVSDEVLRSVMTAIRYNQVHALAAAAVGLAVLQSGIAQRHPALPWAGWLFVIGTLLFSFSIYASAALGIPALTGLAPFGGVLLMAAWLCLAWAGLRSRSRRRDG